jgi:hypothetical protein
MAGRTIELGGLCTVAVFDYDPRPTCVAVKQGIVRGLRQDELGGTGAEVFVRLRSFVPKARGRQEDLEELEPVAKWIPSWMVRGRADTEGEEEALTREFNHDLSSKHCISQAEESAARLYHSTGCRPKNSFCGEQFVPVVLLTETTQLLQIDLTGPGPCELPSPKRRTRFAPAQRTYDFEELHTQGNQVRPEFEMKRQALQERSRPMPPPPDLHRRAYETARPHGWDAVSYNPEETLWLDYQPERVQQHMAAHEQLHSAQGGSHSEANQAGATRTCMQGNQGHNHSEIGYTSSPGRHCGQLDVGSKPANTYKFPPGVGQQVWHPLNRCFKGD